MAQFRANGELDLNGSTITTKRDAVTLIEETNPQAHRARQSGLDGKKLRQLSIPREGVWGIKPRNREQHFAFDAG
jgi:PhoH-like ATPase